MTNTILLKELITESGYKIGFLCEKLKLSRQGFYNKLEGKSEFMASEIAILTNLLKMSPEQQRACFFAQYVD